MNTSAKYQETLKYFRFQIINGIRVHYPQPAYFQQEQLGQECCTIFKIKQAVSCDMLNDISYDLKSETKEQPGRGRIYHAANALRDSFVDCNQPNTSRLLSELEMTRWPTGPFEEFLEDNVRNYWITAQWFQKSEYENPHQDFGFLLTVNAILPAAREVWDREYGEAIVMTKMMQHS